ncbi:MAG: RHS repeat protein [Betaproteobacteria bacterium]|nr:RHS repeat protein [Betaproteobacteria bacterium]
MLPAVANGPGGPLVRPLIATTLNVLGAPVSATDANGQVTILQYDGSGRVTQTTYPDGSTTRQTFDSLGRRTSVTNEEGQTTNFGYDGLGQLTSVSGHAGDANYAYDEVGNLVAQTDALGRSTTFRYDALNRMIEKTYPGGDAERYAYDAVGNLVARTDGLARTITFIYDEVDRLTTKTLPGGITIRYTYKPDGQRATITEPRGVTTYSYDSVGQLSSVTHPTGETVSYVRDVSGNLLSLASPSATVSYDYDALNRLSQVTAPEGQSRADYDLVGNRVRQTAANGIVTDATFDARNRLTLLAHRNASSAVLQSYASVYSPAGRRTRVTELDGSVENYAYDTKGRLASETRTGTNPFTDAHVYDSVGNRVQTARGGIPTTFTYNSNDQILSDGTAAYAWDANGNLIRKTQGATVTQYVFDPENRLLSIVGNSLSNQYAYDADGNRILAATASGTTRFLVDTANNTGLAQVLEEKDGSGTLQARYSYGNELLAQARGATPSYLVHDVFGSTRALADNGGTITDRYQYDAYGRAVSATGSTVNPYRYRGERLDSDSGFYQLRARYYDPSQGRFASRDPLRASRASRVTAPLFLCLRGSRGLQRSDGTGSRGRASGQIATLGIFGTTFLPGAAVVIAAGCQAATTLSFVSDVLLFGSVGIAIAQAAYFNGSQGKGKTNVIIGPRQVSKTGFIRKFEGRIGYPPLTAEFNVGLKGDLSGAISYAAGKGFGASGSFTVPLIKFQACGQEVGDLGVKIKGKFGQKKVGTGGSVLFELETKAFPLRFEVPFIDVDSYNGIRLFGLVSYHPIDYANGRSAFSFSP